ncbi:MAG TPA: PA14 domain-containing protein, partial [bacterium]
YLFGALAFFLRGIRKQKPFSLALSVLFCGLGLYDYQSLKAVPLLLLVLAGFERSRATPEKKISRQIFFALVFLLILLAAPLLNEMASYHTFGKREGEAFILNRVFETKSLAPIPEIWGGTLLMFNRVGDSYPLANIPGHRMLDDLTGILFLLGLAMAWRVRRERKGFYPLASFFILSLPGLLSSDAAASNRLIGLTPFIAYFAGFAGDELFRATLAQARKIRTPLILVVVFCLLAITAQNTYTYFVLQATDLRCQQAFGLEPNYIGKTIVQLQSANPNRFHFFIGPFYFRNPTVEFLSYQARKDVFEFQLTDWAKGIEPLNKDAILFLEAGQTGVVNFLKTLFPMGREETYRDPEGHALLYLYFIPQESLTSATKWNKGLQGNYIHSGRWTEPAVMTRLDPVLNFSSLADFGFFTLPPYLIRWTGTLKIKGGNYEFQLLTPDSAKLWLDGKTVALEKPVALVPGSHTLRVDYEKDSGYYTALHLVWKKPGAENWEVVPATAFGHVSDLGLAVSR